MSIGALELSHGAGHTLYYSVVDVTHELCHRLIQLYDIYTFLFEGVFHVRVKPAQATYGEHSAEERENV